MLTPLVLKAWLRESVRGYLAPIRSEMARQAKPDPLELSATTAGPAGAADKLRVFARRVAGRPVLAAVEPSGLVTRLQPLLGTRRLSLWAPSGATSTQATSWGGAWKVSAFAATTPTDTPVGRIRRVLQSAAAAAGSLAALTSEAGYSLNTGFHVVGHFCPYAAGDVASRRFFAGLAAAAPANAALSGFAGLGVQADVGQTTLRMRGVNGVALDLGADFPANSGAVWYRLELFCAPGAGSVGWEITQLLSGRSASGSFSGAQLPAPGAFMAARQLIMATAALAQTQVLGQWAVETEL